MSADFDDSISRREAIEEYARLFREAAARFRQDLTWLEEHQLQSECGRWICQAYKLGYLPVEPSLKELIDWYTADGSNDPKPKKKATYVRCFSNLFLDLAGGRQLLGMLQNGKWVAHEDPLTGTSRTGGLFPSDVPALLNLPSNERQAKACERLARRIESSRLKVSGAKATPSVKRNGNGDAEIIIDSAIEQLIECRDWTIGNKTQLVSYAEIPKSTGLRVMNKSAKLKALWAKYCHLRSAGRGPKSERRSQSHWK